MAGRRERKARSEQMQLASAMPLSSEDSDRRPAIPPPTRVGNRVALSCPSLPLRSKPVEEPRKWNGFAHVMQAACVGDKPFQPQAEACMRHTAVPAQIKVPLKSFHR